MIKKILFLIFCSISAFVIGMIYITYDVYHESLKVEGRAKGYYKAILISKYVKYFWDDYSMDTIITLKSGLKTLSEKERFSLYRELLINCDNLCGNIAYLGEFMMEMINHENNKFLKYLKNYLKSNSNISKKDKKIIRDYINRRKIK